MDVIGRRRTPAEPGPGQISSATLAALDLAIGRRIDGLLAGEYRSPFAGVGSEFHQVRLYSAGDDVRRIDWNVTARTGEAHVRIELPDRILITWIVLDMSASMGFGTAQRRKADVAEGVSIALGHIATRRASQLGIVVFGGDHLVFRYPRQGRRGLLLALGASREAPSGAGGLDLALELLAGLARRRSLVVIVSDFRDAADWRAPLLRVAARHRTLAVEIRDPRELELVDIGELRLMDIESGEQLIVDTQDPDVREAFAAAAAEERQELATLLRSAGIPHVALSTQGDWLNGLARFLRGSGRR